MSSVRPESESARKPAITVFVSDPSAEAERISQALRGHGFAVVDVPLSMLVARVSVQRPRVVLMDADAEGALDAVARIRELPEADSIDVLFCGRAGAVLANTEDARAHEGSGFFARPVDVSALVRKVEVLSSTDAATSSDARSVRAPSVPNTRDAQFRPTPAPPPISPASNLPGSESPPARSSIRVQGPLSPELEQLLAEAEKRIGAEIEHDSIPPSPEEEIDAVLPEEILAALDDPLDDEEDVEDVAHEAASLALHRATTYDGESRQTTTGNVPHATTGTGLLPTTDDLIAQGPSLSEATTGARYGQVDATNEELRISIERSSFGPLPPPPPLRDRYSAPPSPRPARADDRMSTRKRPSRASPIPIPGVLGPGQAPRALATAVAARATGSLCFESADGRRRAVLREGDMVTAASDVSSESLLAFLVARGDLPRERFSSLAERVPAFGRHAGAALVAHGYLRQDQLWPVLRAHAEWLLGQMLQITKGTATMEIEPPGRLRAEPSVFGGAAGAEVFVEVVRRVISPDDALSALFGEASRLARGANWSLFGECALSPTEINLIEHGPGKTIAEISSADTESDITSVLYALSLLEVLEVVRAVGDAHAIDEDAPQAAIEAIDEQAIRARVNARLAVVNDGDYFAVLGLAHDATGYEIRRAFLELRRAFDPSRILSPQLADLADDVRKIVSVFEEAYEILRDGARRERYRRAIDTVPN